MSRREGSDRTQCPAWVPRLCPVVGRQGPGLGPAQPSICKHFVIDSRLPASARPPHLRESARAVPRMRKYRRAARLGCNGARWSTRSSTAVTTGFVRGHRAPVTTNNRRPHRDFHHRCTRMCKRPNLPPVPRSSPASSKLQLRTVQSTQDDPSGASGFPLSRSTSFGSGSAFLAPTAQPATSKLRPTLFLNSS
jgi:hypothetical protein